MNETTTPGPFAGLRVIEFGRFIAAPYCGQLLADGGADVVKVEPLEGDASRRNGTQLTSTEARQYLNKNRGKRSLAVKLRDPEVLGAIKKLVRRADVLITNFRPGLAARLGLDYETVATTNPRIVYAENTGFGHRGPLAGVAGMDLALQGYAGLAPLTADGPLPIADPVVDYGAALLMAFGISTALFHRERTGKGQRLDVSLLQSALMLQNNTLSSIEGVDDWRTDFVDQLQTAFQNGKTWSDVRDERARRDGSAAVRSYYGFFETADGMIAIAAGGPGLRAKMAELLGVEDPSLMGPSFVADDPDELIGPVYGEVTEKLRARTTESWIEEFHAAGIPVGPVHIKEEVLDDSQAWANEYFVRVEHETVGTVQLVEPPVKFSGTPLASTASPTLGKHSLEVLEESGLSKEEVAALIARGVVVAQEPAR